MRTDTTRTTRTKHLVSSALQITCTSCKIWGSYLMENTVFVSCAKGYDWCVIFEVFMVVTMKNAVFWNVTPFGSCKNRCFGGPYLLHHPGEKNRRTRNNVSSNWQLIMLLLARWFIPSCWRGRYIPPDRGFLQEPHRAITEDGILQGTWCLAEEL
jgi:hypothetical protein